jgi:hypothetical protein
MIDRRVVLKVGSAEYDLIPTLESMKKVNRRFGSLVDALSAVRRLDFDALIFIAAAGASMGQKETEHLERLVFENGVMTAVTPVADFLAILMNPLGDDAEGTDSGNR